MKFAHHVIGYSGSRVISARCRRPRVSEAPTDSARGRSRRQEKSNIHLVQIAIGVSRDVQDVEAGSLRSIHRAQADFFSGAGRAAIERVKARA